MGFLADILNRLTYSVNFYSEKIPSLTDFLPFPKLKEALNVLSPYWSIANSIFPMDTVFSILKLLLGFSIALVIFWFVQRLINLIRGSG